MFNQYFFKKKNVILRCTYIYISSVYMNSAGHNTSYQYFFQIKVFYNLNKCNKRHKTSYDFLLAFYILNNRDKEYNIQQIFCILVGFCFLFSFFFSNEHTMQTIKTIFKKCYFTFQILNFLLKTL